MLQCRFDNLPQILAAIRAETSASRKVYWLISDLPDEEVDLVRHVARIARGVWVVAHDPPAMESFEDHWRLLQDVKITVSLPLSLGLCSFIDFIVHNDDST